MDVENLKPFPKLVWGNLVKGFGVFEVRSISPEFYGDLVDKIRENENATNF